MMLERAARALAGERRRKNSRNPSGIPAVPAQAAS